MYTIVLAMRYPVQRLGISSNIYSAFKEVKIIEAGNEENVVNVALGPSTDLVILDPDLLGTKMHEFFVQQDRATTPVLVYSTGDERLFAGFFIRMGAAGYIEQRCSRDQLIAAVSTVLQGHTYLSDSIRKNYLEGSKHHTLTITEGKILYYLLKGYLPKSISEIMNISLSTINTHKSHIFRKLSVTSRKQLMEMARSIY